MNFNCNYNTDCNNPIISLIIMIIGKLLNNSDLSKILIYMYYLFCGKKETPNFKHVRSISTKAH